jgi:hypothetical protein
MRATDFLCGLLLLPLCSCTVGSIIVGEAALDSDAAAPQPFYDYSLYFRAFDNPWVGRSRDELIMELGAPDAIYEARHQFADFDAGIPAATYIYINGTERSGGCIDAYVVDEPTATVIKYYCR